MSVERELRRLEDEVSGLRKALSKSQLLNTGLAHVVVEAGVIPGESTCCHCNDCREVAEGMAAAGYLTHVTERWWEQTEET